MAYSGIIRIDFADQRFIRKFIGTYGNHIKLLEKMTDCALSVRDISDKRNRIGCPHVYIYAKSAAALYRAQRLITERIYQLQKFLYRFTQRDELSVQRALPSSQHGRIQVVLNRQNASNAKATPVPSHSSPRQRPELANPLGKSAEKNAENSTENPPSSRKDPFEAIARLEERLAQLEKKLAEQDFTLSCLVDNKLAL